MSTAIYVRLSSDAKGDRLGVTRQLEDCHKLCAARGWSDPVVFEDNDISAYSGKRRPAYEQMLDAVKAGDVNRVVAWHPDRLHRRPVELERFIEIIEAAACDVVTVLEGHYDLTTPGGRMTARILGSVARAESEHKSERIRRKKLEVAQSGRWTGGSRPFGYDIVRRADGTRTLEPRPDEAVVVAEMMRRFLSGETRSSLLKWLNTAGIPTVTGREKWNRSTITGILRSAVISGQRDHHGVITTKGDWPAIVAPEETLRARFLLIPDPGKCIPYSAHAFSGLLRCGACGKGMTPDTTGRKGGYKKNLRCARMAGGCGRISIRQANLFNIIEEAVLKAADTALLGASVAQPAKTPLALVNAADRAEKQLQELAIAYADEAISMAEWQTARDRIQAQLDTARTAMTGRGPVAALLPYRQKPGALRAAWPDLSVGEQQAITHALIRTITIAPTLKPGAPFDPDRITIDWKN